MHEVTPNSDWQSNTAGEMYNSLHTYMHTYVSTYVCTVPFDFTKKEYRLFTCTVKFSETENIIVTNGIITGIIIFFFVN